MVINKKWFTKWSWSIKMDKLYNKVATDYLLKVKPSSMYNLQTDKSMTNNNYCFKIKIFKLMI